MPQPPAWGPPSTRPLPSCAPPARACPAPGRRDRRATWGDVGESDRALDPVPQSKPALCRTHTPERRAGQVLGLCPCCHRPRGRQSQPAEGAASSPVPPVAWPPGTHTEARPPPSTGGRGALPWAPSNPRPRAPCARAHTSPRLWEGRGVGNLRLQGGRGAGVRFQGPQGHLQWGSLHPLAPPSSSREVGCMWGVKCRVPDSGQGHLLWEAGQGQLPVGGCWGPASPPPLTSHCAAL